MDADMNRAVMASDWERVEKLKAQQDRPATPVDDVMRWLEKDCVRLTQLADQLDSRLAAVMGEGVPHPSAPEEAAPGTSALVGALALIHVRLSGELDRLERMSLRVEVG